MNSDNIFYSKQLIYEVKTTNSFEEIETIYFRKENLNYLNFSFLWKGQRVHFKYNIFNLNGSSTGINSSENLGNIADYQRKEIKNIDISSLTNNSYILKIYLKKNESSITAYLKDLTIYLTGE